MDTVPPFFPSREDDEHIWGRGACDTKGIIASMIFAVRELLEAGHRNSRCCSWWARSATARARWQPQRIPRGSKFLINGEPTENKLALGSKGALRLELVANGRMAHSAYPELGESAIEKLLDALAESPPRAAAGGQNPRREHAEYRNHRRAAALPTSFPITRRPNFSSAWWTMAMPRARPIRQAAGQEVRSSRSACHSGGAAGLAAGF